MPPAGGTVPADEPPGFHPCGIVRGRVWRRPEHAQDAAAARCAGAGRSLRRRSVDLSPRRIVRSWPTWREAGSGRPVASGRPRGCPGRRGACRCGVPVRGRHV